MEIDNTKMQLDFVDPAALELKMDEFKRVCLMNHATGEYFEDVELKLMFPLSNRNRFLAAYKDGREVALIRDFRQMNPGSRQVVAEVLDKHYFIPEIINVRKVEEEYRMIHWYVDTNRGPLDFYTRTRNDVVVKGRRIYIRDIDSNRYLIGDVTKLSPESQREISSEI